ncbi:dynein heavy chain and region D6 of dynein motor-domain-containing protein [Neocallimastix lanati (nom. inval.)]|nr:dynein heavy chain and region D6 of dynein motor-domain-containing protein [Neocallimastix sp. JGI-2020a]
METNTEGDDKNVAVTNENIINEEKIKSNEKKGTKATKDKSKKSAKGKKKASKKKKVKEVPVEEEPITEEPQPVQVIESESEESVIEEINDCLESSIYTKEFNEFKISEDIDNLVNWFKIKIEILLNCNNLWNESHNNIIKTFINENVNKKIIAYIEEKDEKTLILSSTFPKYNIKELVYFIRLDSKEKLNYLNINNIFQYGILNCNSMEGLLKSMKNLYIPLLNMKNTWPETVKNEFENQLQKFMASLTDATYQKQGYTIFYVPNDDYSNPNKFSMKEDIQRLESLLIHWTRQIKDVINNQQVSETNENLGPLEEIQFWKRRCEDLSGISKQLERTDVKRIIYILEKAKSSYIEQFNWLSNQIQDDTLQAQDNLRFLSTLQEPCMKLAQLEPKNISGILPTLLNCVRVIWSHSKYYNSKERLTSLLRKISNEIIRRCCSTINLEDIFFGDVLKSMNYLNESINCGESWKGIYIKMVNQVARFSSTGAWDFDQSSIFAQLDAFIQRCKDLLEVCESQIQFARKIENGEKKPIPKFGGLKGPKIAKSLADIEVSFEKQLQSLWKIKHYILDVKSTRWHDDYSLFKHGIKDLEIMMQNIISSAFEDAATFEGCMELLEVFDSIAKRDAIKRTLEKKTADIHNLYLQKLNNIKTYFEKYKKEPELIRFHPFYAGAALWAKSLLNEIKATYSFIDKAFYLPTTSFSEEIKINYNILTLSLEDFITKNHTEWVNNIPDSIENSLNYTIMVKNGKFLEMQFDSNLLKLFNEVHYWQKLKFDIPFQIQEIVSKNEELRILRENVLLVVRDYNSIIESLNDKEQSLFKERIKFLDRKIKPGLTVLTWGSKGIADYFVKECRRSSNEIQSIVNDFKGSNKKIENSCRNIEDTLLWNVEYKKVYTLEEFKQSQIDHLIKVKKNLKTIHDSIKYNLRCSYEFFLNDGKEIQIYWGKYVKEIDKKVEEALRMAVKKSLQEIAKAINGEGKGREENNSEIQPLFKVNVILDNKKVGFDPSLEQLENVVNSSAQDMILLLKNIPRLTDKLNIQDDEELPSFYDIIINEEDIQKYFVTIQNGMTNNGVKCQEYIKSWDNYREIWEINKDAFIRRYAKSKPALSTFDADINRYNEVANNTQKEETFTNIYFALLDCSLLKHDLVTHCVEWQNKLTTLLNDNAKQELNDLYELFQTNTEKLSKPPTTLDELSSGLKLISELKENSESIQGQFSPIHEKYQILEKYEVPITENEKERLEGLNAHWEVFQQVVEESDKAYQEYKSKFKTEVLQSVDEFTKYLSSLSEEFESKGPFESSIGYEKAEKTISEFIDHINEAKKKEEVIRYGLNIFKIEQPPFKDIEKLNKNVDIINRIWQYQGEWDKLWNSSKLCKFKNVDMTKIEETSQRLYKNIVKISRESNFHEWNVWSVFKDQLAQLKRSIPLIGFLQDPSLRERHWNQLMEEIGRRFDPYSEEFTLEKVMDLGIDQYSDLINEIYHAATKELLIEQGIEAIKKAWDEFELDIATYKDKYYKLRSTDDLFELLEENQISLSSMKSSKFVVAFEKQIDMWERALSRIIEVVELLLQVQRQWMYLENIFIGTEDIRKQLPKESSIFDSVNESWKSVMENINNDKNALRATKKNPDDNKDIMNILNQMNSHLEAIQKSLNMYLETKRQAFPRFYFISNDDLLEILGQARDPTAIQPHLKKCFDNIYRLELGLAGVDNRRHNEGIGMYSADGEYVQFSNIVVLEGPVEYWLLEVESMMRTTLHKLLYQCLISIEKMKKDKWFKTWPGQMLITAGLINWTMECSKSLEQAEKGDKHALKNLKKKQISLLKKLSDIVRSPLNKIERQKIVSLITIEVHSRDIIDKMYKAECSNPNDFEWVSQMRFYWDKDEDDCVINQINTHFKYGYEYLGNSGRLVITPLTDRCYMTLTTALHLFRGGSPQGPAGTGKTETVKDLGKALGKYVIVQNCSESLDYKSIGRMFSGLAQTGAWGCFDEFNRIDIEVLSVVALQISCILNAISRNVRSFVFESQTIKLNTSCGIFITMNPGYAGRVELPDNLKSLFRPVSMMVPDSAMIAEIMLFAEGFSNTRVLSKKVESLYRLSSQQLSKQDHYDFGLRALTSALRTAGIKKRKDMSIPDDIVLYLAMKDMNVPKLTSSDTPLFMGILSDLFPGIEIPEIDNSEFLSALSEEFKENNLQEIKAMIVKIVQLYETKKTRHGVMIVGQSGSGKTTVWKLLKNTMTRLSKTKPEEYVPVKIFPLNPKAISQGEFYGEFNINTNEWTDGIFSNIMRTTCSDEKKDQKWILLDGPVDTLWIESMNTLLDDNKVLTLINGERIALPEQVSLLFEVDNLSNASPATVSRAGMIYMDYNDLGWRPYVDSWLESKRENNSYDIIKKLIDKYIQKVFDFRKKCKETIPIQEYHVIKCFCSLYDVLVTPQNGVDYNDQDGLPRLLEQWFLFTLVWSFGGSLNEKSRKKFDMFIRELEGQFPSKDTVFEYVVDKQSRTWVSWEEKLPSGWKYSTSIPFYKILVPTIDTIRNEFILRNIIQNNIPVLVVGDVGIGKTSIVQNLLSSMEETYTILNINMSARTSSNNIQNIFESKIEKRTKNVFIPQGGKHLITFIDDFNLPKKDEFGSQPPLEFIRHWMDYGFWYDRQKQLIKYVNDISIIAAMGPPGGGRNVISNRTLSHFFMLNMTFPQESSLKRIYGTLVNQKYQDFEEEVKPLGDIMTNATIEIYQAIVTQLLPTPTKIHYLFNLRDISKVFQGLLRANKEYFDSKESIMKLWVHEIFRVFSDRLINKEDKAFFIKLVDEKMVNHFSYTLKQVCTDKVIPIFGDFMSEGSGDTLVYEEISDAEKLKNFMEERLQDYNIEPGYIPLDIVLFRDAIEHICRIVRVLRLQCGNVLLIGVGGSGRQSLTRLAAYIVENETFQIKISKQYRFNDFRDDIKNLFEMTGINGKPTTFLMTDTQVICTEFLEDLSNILSSGEVPNLYAPDELNDLKEKIRPYSEKENIPDNINAMYSFFIERVRANLHVVFCISPVGENFRNTVRMFPSFVNCTTIDWFSEWPEDALMEVAYKYLSKFEFESDVYIKAISQVFVTVHTSVIKYSEKMKLELKRYNYVTPINYIELVTGYVELIKNKKKEIEAAALKLKNGLSKLDDTRVLVEKISIDLEKAKVQMVQYQKECEEYLVTIVQQRREADEQAKQVSARSEKLAIEEEDVRAVAVAAQNDLDLAMPKLIEAMKALEALNKKDLQEVRSYGKPPVLVEKVMEAVMVLKKCEPTWDEAKRQLGNPNFIKQLVNFDKDNISDKYCSDENFNPEIVGRVSSAAKSLCMWVMAMESYGHIYRVVAPKKEKLRLAQETLEKKQKSVREANEKLQEIKNQLNELQSQYDEKIIQKENLRVQSEETEVKLSRAEQLVTGLSGEKDRWETSIKNYEESLHYLPGDCLLASAFLSYAGSFNSIYRSELVNNHWITQIKAREIPFSSDYCFENFLGKPTEIREWNIQGLPSDQFSSENGIIVKRGTRWPLLIDPQDQANKWIKNMESKNNLKIIDIKQPDILRTLENSIQYGNPVLLQGISETIDPSLDPILNKEIIKQGNSYFIKLGTKEIEYNTSFKLYLTTKLANPHYSPEIFAKVTIVNFAVKEQGLEDQLLGIVVKREKPELEEKKNNLVINVAMAKKKLVELEDEILYLLSTAQGSLLDDATLVNTLQSSKQTSQDVAQQLEVSVQTEAQIDQTREGYRPCAQRASILFFVLNDLSTIDPMYQFSLDSYIDLFDNSITKSEQNEDLVERINNLNEYHTYAVYKSTCRGLFEEHKLLFALHITVKILLSAGKINEEEYSFLLHGGQVINRETQLPNPCNEWISETTWDNITELEKLPAFNGLVSSFEQGEREWKQWFINSEPEEIQLPGEWENKLNDLQRMLIVRSLRLDRVTFCIQKFIKNNLGQKFTEPPILNIEDIYEDSNSNTPLIFVLSPGVDPTGMLIKLAEKKKMSDKFNYLSLGQGQSPKATRLIEEGIRDGLWVFLANCHLSISWMPTLEKIIENIGYQKVHKNFRLWLSSSPHPKFPIYILQTGIKMTTEPPKGLKANLSRLYNKQTDENLNSCKVVDNYKNLFFSLCFYHSILIERKKFLTLGWNVVCDFNDSDFEVCDNLLKLLLDDYEETPWDALKYLIAEANYGGRVTDDWDRRVLRSYINHYFCNEALTIPRYSLSSMDIYYIPEPGTIQQYKEYIASLPNFDKPEVFGQHSNADIKSQIEESNKLLFNLLSLMPQNASQTGDNNETKVINIVNDILKRIPENIDYDYTYKSVQFEMSPTDVVLLQEIIRYNNLLNEMRVSLNELLNGIKGIVVMSPELEEMYNYILDGRVPKIWNNYYQSLQPLAGWTRDLILRIEFFDEWSKGTIPKVYWLGAFIFPVGFLTALLQKTSRKNNIPIDVLGWEFIVQQIEDENHITQEPKDGAYIKNIFLEGASWDKKNNCLTEPIPMELLTPMPPIHFKPIESKKKQSKGNYTCPIYYYSIRTGTRERPSFVIAMELKSGNHDSDFWVKRGTAALLSPK